MNEEEQMKKFCRIAGMQEMTGFAIGDINPDEYDETLWFGETLEEALEGNFRKTSFWTFPEVQETCYEDLSDAVEQAEDALNMTFEEFKRRNKLDVSEDK